VAVVVLALLVQPVGAAGKLLDAMPDGEVAVMVKEVAEAPALKYTVLPLANALPLTVVVRTGTGSTVTATFSVVVLAVLFVALTPLRVYEKLAGDPVIV
jgi:hypothetical protein